MILAVSDHNLPLPFRQRRPESPPKVLILLDPGLRISGDTVEDELKRYGGSNAVARAAIQAVNRRLAETNIIASGSFDGGRAFEINTQVFYWLTKA